jgi:predicted Kef-type K+ transport protein
MNTVLNRRIGGEQFDRSFAWAAGFALATACTTLVLKALPDLGLVVSGVLIGSLAVAWVVLGRFVPVRSADKQHL